MLSQWKMKAIYTLACLFLFASAGYGYNALVLKEKTVVPGVFIAGMDISGLNRLDALEKVRLLERQAVHSAPLALRYRGLTWLVDPVRIGLSADCDTMVDKALDVGRSGDLVQRWKERRQVKTSGLNLSLLVKPDNDMLARELDRLAADFAEEPRDAELQITDDGDVEIIPSRDGTSFNVDAACSDIIRLYQATPLQPVVDLTMVSRRPAKTTEDMLALGINGLLSTYTTNFNAKDIDRSYNINVAAEALEGIMLAPLEAFSFNKVVGPRSTEAGYKNAKVILNNELVDGVGGGVCQVSTTLYNSVLLSDLEITSKTNHSIPVAYVPPGRDATVTDNYIDLGFRNNTGSHIWIKTSMGQGRITINIYGNKSYKKQVTIRTKILEEIPFKEIIERDSLLAQNEVKLKRKGSVGYRVQVEKVMLPGEGPPVVERLPNSFYYPVHQLVLVGPGVKESDVRNGKLVTALESAGGSPGSGPAEGTTGNGAGAGPPPAGNGQPGENAGTDTGTNPGGIVPPT